MNVPIPGKDADVPDRSHQDVRQTLSSISLALGICSPLASFIIPLMIAFDSSSTGGRFPALIPAGLLLAGLALALIARRRGEVGRLASSALSWNTLLCIVYAVVLIALLLNPVSPS